MTTITIEILDDTQEANYLDACARIRNVSRTRLIRDLIEVIMNDKLVEATLDDADNLTRSKSKVRETVYHAPKQEASSGTGSWGVGSYPKPKGRVVLSKTQMREQLTQAVVNTGGRRITKEDRRQMLIERIKAAGRLCPSDLGDADEQGKWQVALRELFEEGVLMKNLPDASRRVYYELRPPTHETVSPLPVSEMSSPDASAGGDHIDVPEFLPSRADA